MIFYELYLQQKVQGFKGYRCFLNLKKIKFKYIYTKSLRYNLSKKYLNFFKDLTYSVFLRQRLD